MDQDQKRRLRTQHPQWRCAQRVENTSDAPAPAQDPRGERWLGGWPARHAAGPPQHANEMAALTPRLANYCPAEGTTEIKQLTWRRGKRAMTEPHGAVAALFNRLPTIASVPGNFLLLLNPESDLLGRERRHRDSYRRGLDPLPTRFILRPGQSWSSPL